MVSIIDADMVVRADFYQRTLPYLQTERDALVLAPQVCPDPNPDPTCRPSATRWCWRRRCASSADPSVKPDHVILVPASTPLSLAGPRLSWR